MQITFSAVGQLSEISCPITTVMEEFDQAEMPVLEREMPVLNTSVMSLTLALSLLKHGWNLKIKLNLHE